MTLRGRVGDTMSELLAPAGSMEALITAIHNGADAIYLGMNRFGARAYANNFTINELKEAVKYAHLRGVKIYVTMNIIVFDSELEDAYKQVDELYLAGVDGLIIQDLAVFTYVTEHYPSFEAHCSTQMGLDDLDGALLFKELGAARVVLSREVPQPELVEIRKKSKIQMEIFVHGALCVSYSGNCLLSGLIGYRSGNRGRCVGACRKPYTLVNLTENKIIDKSYVLSMKDLNTVDHIEDLKFADSLKIEGRMKEPSYVANVIRTYRDALDGKATMLEKKNLEKTFQRGFTKGYIFGEDKKDITNVLRPNHAGEEIGYISRRVKNGYEITVNEPVCQGDIIRIDHNNNDIILTLVKMLDNNDNLINTASKKFIVRIKEEASVGDTVYRTKDINFENQLLKQSENEFKRFPIDISVYGAVGAPLSVTASFKDTSVSFETEYICQEALNNPTDEEKAKSQIAKLNDTIYYLNEFYFYADNCFIPVKELNEIRRKAVSLLNEERTIINRPERLEDKAYPKVNESPSEGLELAVFANTLDQARAAKELGIKTIYFDNVIRRNLNEYKDMGDKELLIGGYGGIHHYMKTNKFVTDFSLNVVNWKSVYELAKLGAKRVCLSHEINLTDINDLVNDYKKYTGSYPNLEMIVYGKADMMFTKYCPLKVYGQCGKCKKNKYELRDDYGNFPIISHDDCTTTILNGKNLNLIDELETIKNVNTFRINLTNEDYNESLGIIKLFQEKMKTMEKTHYFNKDTDTRGHFNKEIL